MSIALDSTSDNSGAIEVGGVQRIILGADGSAELHQSPTQESPPKHIATMEALQAYGGMPRFTPYVWGGKASAMPAGDTQSSGQQLLDMQYRDMRADVVATQFTCTETEWQADPYKRVTHWSLGDGVSWMRPPDKNCVQPGSLEGGFYGSGVGSGSPLLGTTVLDQMQSFKGRFEFRPSATDAATSSGGTYYTVSMGAGYQTDVAIVEDGANGAPRLGKLTRPRTWYGIWMIRMYGRVLNTGTLDAAGLNARMDMLDAHIALLDKDQHSITNMTSARVIGVEYKNTSNRNKFLHLEGPIIIGGGAIKVTVGGKDFLGSSYPTAGLSSSCFAVVPPNATYIVPAGYVSVVRTWLEIGV